MSDGSKVDFLGENPIELADKLEALAKDIRSLAKGRNASRMLDDAPVLAHAAIYARARPALVGSVSNHPVLGSQDQCTTSEVYALASDRSWARTLSRFYVLAAPRTH